MRKTINSNKLQFDTVRFCTSSDNISLIEGKEHLFKHTLDMETGELSIIEFNSQAIKTIVPLCPSPSISMPTDSPRE